MKPQYICTNCHFVGLGNKAGSGLLEFIGWVSFVLPGIAYGAWRNKHKHSVCPKCQERKMIPLDTPVGQELATKYQIPESVQRIEPIFSAPNMEKIAAVAGPVINHPHVQKTGGVIKAILKLAFQVLAFLLFLLMAVGAWEDARLLSIGYILLAPFTLRVISKRIPKPLNDARIVFAALAIYAFWAAGASLDASETKHTKLVAQQKQKMLDDALAAYQANPEETEKEIAALIAKKDYGEAKYRTKQLLATNDPEILAMHEKAVDGVAAALKVEKEAQRKQEQENQRIQNESRSAELKGMDMCKAEIARFLSADGAGAIPDVQNHGSDNEFIYAWPKGLVTVTSVFGTAGISASCDGSLKPLKVMSLSINGKTIILNGRRVFE